MSSGPAVVCAWCKAVLSRGSRPASPGVCTRCLDRHLRILADPAPGPENSATSAPGSRRRG